MFNFKILVMNNRIDIVLLYAICTVFLGSCSKEILEEEKIISPPINQYFKTEKGFNDLVNSNYTFAKSLFAGGNNYAPLVFFGTDLWTNGSDGTFIEFNAYNTGIQPGNPVLWELWSPFYQGIAACNTAISRADDVEDVPESQVNRKVAESYFLRAWYYHILVVHFGDLPLVTEEVTDVVTTATRTPEAEVYTQIVNDLL